MTLCLAAGLLRLGNRRVYVVLTDDRLISRLSGEYRKSPHPTDVLAFAYEDEKDIAGEIIISLDTAQRQARQRGMPLELELALLGVHGLLHIMGQDDETQRGWRAMRVREFEILAKVL